MFTQSFTEAESKSSYLVSFHLLQDFAFPSSITLNFNAKPRNNVPNLWIFSWAPGILIFKSQLTDLPSTFSSSTQQLHFLLIQNSAIFHFSKQRLFPQHKQFSVSEGSYILLVPWHSVWQTKTKTKAKTKHQKLRDYWNTRNSFSFMVSPTGPTVFSLPFQLSVIFQSSIFLHQTLFSVLHLVRLLTGLEGGGMKSSEDIQMPVLH